MEVCVNRVGFGAAVDARMIAVVGHEPDSRRIVALIQTRTVRFKRKLESTTLTELNAMCRDRSLNLVFEISKRGSKVLIDAS